MTEEEFGRYRLVSLIGRGSMGEVWRAVDTEKDREVALKVLGSWLGGDPDFAARFRRESALAARLNSPNIVTIHDYGEIDGRLFIDMPLVDGTDLGALLQQGPLPSDRAVGIIVQAARALAVAHRAGLVHRDVKPSNILVSTTVDGDDHVYLIDFGITKALDGTRLSMSGAVVGTAAYMAPECFAGAGDARSDVYSLGCVLYEALTGQPPFSAPHAFAYAHLHQHEPAPRPSVARADVPPVLDEVVVRALAKSPDDRFATVADLATAARGALQPASVAVTAVIDPSVGAARLPVLDDLLPAAGRPGPAPGDRTPTVIVPAGPPGAGPPRSRRRHRLVLISGLVTVLVLVVVVAVVDFRPSTPPAPTEPPAPPAPAGLITSLTGIEWGLRAVAVAQVDGRPVAAIGTGATGDTVEIWDLTTRQRIGRPLLASGSGASAVAITRVDGRSAVVASGGSWFDNQSVLLWDLTTQQRLRQPFADDVPGSGPFTGVDALTHLDGRPVAVVRIADDKLRVWDLTAGTQLGQPFGSGYGLRAVALTQLGGQTIALTNNLYDETVQMWDVTTGEQLDRSLVGHTNLIYAVAAGELDGRPVALTASKDATVRIWDVTTGKQLGQPIIVTGSRMLASVLATGELGGRPVAVTATMDGNVLVWDLRIAAAT